MTQEKINIPDTIEEALLSLDEMLLDEDKQFIKENGSISVHHTLGRWIRNNWKLWEEKPNKLKQSLIDLGITHPDDMSDHIIKLYINYLNK